jgi:hypothetical protein
MNWDAIGAIAEMLGATAILVTLVYLAVQIKYAHLTSTDTNRSNRVVGIRELNSNLVIDRDARAAWNKAMGPVQRKLINEAAETLELNFDEASIVVLQGWNWMFTHWTQFRSVKTPEDEEELKNIVTVWYGENPMRALIDNPIFRNSFDPEFVTFVDEVIALNDP